MRLARQPLPGEAPAIEQVRPATVPPPLAPPPAAPSGPFAPDQVRLQLLPFGGTPRPTPETIQRYGRFVDEIVDTDNTLDLVENRPRLMRLNQAPFRIQLGDEQIADYLLITERELSLTGRRTGTTVLNLWFVNPADANNPHLLSYLVRVVPDPEARERLEAVYRALETEINRNFPDSVVRLSLVGDRLLVRGQAKDIEDATQILRIIGANAPGGQEDIPIDGAGADDDLAGLATSAGVDPLTGQLRVEGFQSWQTRRTVRRDSFDIQTGSNQTTGRNRRSSSVINMLRVPGVHQVMLKVTVAEVNREALRSIGASARFGGGDNVGFLSFATSAALPAAGGFFGAPLGGAGGSFLVDTTDFDLALTALKRLGYARSLAEPNLTTLNGRPATLQVGGEFPVPQSQSFTNTAVQNVEFVDFGVRLRFIPIVTEGERVRLTVFAEVSDRNDDGGADIAGTFVPGLETRNFQTQVELREGQTLAVAGLIRNQMNGVTTRVPFLGDAPIVGRLFSSDRLTYRETELVVLVTPHLVHPLEAHERPPLPTASLFEPSDIEFFLLGRIEGSRAEDYRSPVRSDLHRMDAWRRCQQQLIIGPSGYCEEIR